MTIEKLRSLKDLHDKMTSRFRRKAARDVRPARRAISLNLRVTQFCRRGDCRALSRRDCRGQPGVSTPGDRPKMAPPQRGGRELLPNYGFTDITRNGCLPPLQGGRYLDYYPALILRAESCSPLGTEGMIRN
jgi:hypothetical protein